MTKKTIDTSLPAIIKPDPSHDLVIVVDRLKNLSPETKNTYKFAMKSYENYCQNKGLKPDLDSLLQWLESVDASTTQATYIAAVKRIFSEIYKDDPRLPEFKASLEEIRPVKRDMNITSSKYMTKKEIDELIKISPPKLSLIIETLFITALRISELLKLRHDHMTEVKDGKKTYYEMRIIGKRNKENTVYISSDLYKRINKVFSSKVFLFEHDGRKYRREFITMEIKRFGKILGKNISAHKIRHSRAMDLAERGVSLDKISKFLCHASIGTTAGFYLHSKPSLDELNIYKK